jgi:hypothetical protein
MKANSNILHACNSQVHSLWLKAISVSSSMTENRNASNSTALEELVFTSMFQDAACKCIHMGQSLDNGKARQFIGK